jgi:hypothetical protein
MVHFPPRCTLCLAPLTPHCDTPACAWHECPNTNCDVQRVHTRRGRRIMRDGHQEPA